MRSTCPSVCCRSRFEFLTQPCNQFCHNFFGIPLNRTTRLSRLAGSITVRLRVAVVFFHRSISLIFFGHQKRNASRDRKSTFSSHLGIPISRPDEDQAVIPPSFPSRPSLRHVCPRTRPGFAIRASWYPRLSGLLFGRPVGNHRRQISSDSSCFSEASLGFRTK